MLFDQINRCFYKKKSLCIKLFVKIRLYSCSLKRKRSPALGRQSGCKKIFLKRAKESPPPATTAAATQTAFSPSPRAAARLHHAPPPPKSAANLSLHAAHGCRGRRAAAAPPQTRHPRPGAPRLRPHTRKVCT
jgi:hypothetical protein